MEIKIHPTYYATIPADVRYDNRLKANSKLMYGEIVCLSNKYGFCYASNNYFAELYEVSKNTISIWINDLVKAGHIQSTIIRTERNQVKERRISLTNINVRGIHLNDEDNSTSINNTSINNISLRQKQFESNVSKLDYDTQLKVQFCEYWCERNPKGTKMKFEMEKTFDINLRLKRWIRNNKNWNTKTSQKSHIQTTVNTHQKAREMMNSINNAKHS